MNGPSTIDEFLKATARDASRTTNALQTHSDRNRTRSFHRLSAAAKADRLATLPTMAAAGTRQSAQMPSFAPLLEELEVAGWSSHRRMLSGNFHDWSLLENRMLMVMAGQAVASHPSDVIDPIEAALVAQGAWASIRSHAEHAADAGTLLSLVARSLWSHIGGELRLALAIALVDLDGGHTSVAIAGDCLAIRIRAAGCDQVAGQQPALGAVSDFTYLSHSVTLSVRDRVVLMADDPMQRPAKLFSRIAVNFSKLDAESHRRMMAADAIAMVRQEFETASDNNGRRSASIVAVRRR